MRKNKAELRNEISAVLIDVSTESALTELSLTGALGSTAFTGGKSVI